MSRLRRLWERRRATGALADFYGVAPPSGSTRLEDLPILAVDVEATGLDLATDRLLSIGWVPMDGPRIVLAGAREVVISGAQDDGDGVGQSATVHGLTDDMVEAGVPLEDALAELLEALAGRAMLAHFATIEEDFLSAACRSVFGAGLAVPTLDTYALARRRMERDSVHPRGEDLRLPRLRERYGLPSYPPHRAVTDALSCAELFLAMTSPANGRSPYSTLRSAQV
ncbi:exonuclease domain-containing protein [Corynebacteriaceae bacterium 7-707]